MYSTNQGIGTTDTSEQRVLRLQSKMVICLSILQAISIGKEPAISRWLEKLDLDDLKGNEASFQVDYENTIYPQQIREYWDRLRKAQETLQQADQIRQVTPTVNLNRSLLSDIQSAADKLRQTYAEEAFNNQLLEDTLTSVGDMLRVAHDPTLKIEIPLDDGTFKETIALPQENV